MHRDLVDSGVNPGEVEGIMRQQYFGDVNGATPSVPNTAPAATPSTPVPAVPATPAAPATAQATPTTPAPAKPAAPAKTYPHDFSEIDGEAQEALSYFTRDGVPESAYLNIASNSKQNVLKGNALNLSLINKEDMKISFVSGNTVMNEWIFSNWNSDEDYELDLTTTLKPDNESSYPGTYVLTFSDGKTVSDNSIVFNLNLNNPDTEFHVYTRNDGKYEEIYTGMTDGNGILSLNPIDLTEYVLSTTDIIEEQETEAMKLKAEEEAKKKAEAEAAKETTETAATEVTIDSTEVEKENNQADGSKDNILKVADEISATEKPETDKKFPPLIPVLGVFLVIILIAIFILKKKR